LNTLVENSKKEANDFIKEIKLKGQTKESKLKSISELFLEFKNIENMKIYSIIKILMNFHWKRYIQF